MQSGRPRYNRLKICQDAAREGCDVTRAAERLGIRVSALCRWLVRNNHREVHLDLLWNAKHGSVTEGEALRRFKAVVAAMDAGKRLKHAAQELNMNYMALWKWIRENAPDGARQALLDYEVEEA